MLSSVTSLTRRAISGLVASTDPDENPGDLEGDPAPPKDEGDTPEEGPNDHVAASDGPELAVNDGGEMKPSSKKKPLGENGDDLDGDAPGVFEGDVDGGGSGEDSVDPPFGREPPAEMNDPGSAATVKETKDSAHEDGGGQNLMSFASNKNRDDLEGDGPGPFEGERADGEENQASVVEPEADTMAQDGGGRRKHRSSTRKGSSSRVAPSDSSDDHKGEMEAAEAIKSNPEAVKSNPDVSQEGGGKKLRSSPRLSAVQLRSSPRVKAKAAEGDHNAQVVKGSAPDPVVSEPKAAGQNVAEVNCKDDEDKVEKDPRRKLGILPGPGWTRGTFRYKDSVRKSWLTPTRKWAFKYRKDADIFERLRQEHNKDEVRAWIEYTLIQDGVKKSREVIDCCQIDVELGLDVRLLRRQNDETLAIAPGWGVDVDLQRTGKRRTRWVSPTRKIRFRYRRDAELFEDLRQKHGVDEIQAWLEYTKIKHSLKQAREVVDANQFDDDYDVTIYRKNTEGRIGPGWEYEVLPSNSTCYKRKSLWVSPTRKIKFRNRKDAVLFEELRKEHGPDEIQAWIEYTEIKRSLGVRREVVSCDMFDSTEDSQSGRWLESEQELFLKGVEKFGRNYVKIADFLGTRSHKQVKSYARRYWVSQREEAQSDKEEDVSSDELPPLPRPEPSRVQPRRQARQSIDSPANQYSLLDGITNQSLHEKRQASPSEKERSCMKRGASDLSDEEEVVKVDELADMPRKQKRKRSAPSKKAPTPPTRVQPKRLRPETVTSTVLPSNSPLEHQAPASHECDADSEAHPSLDGILDMDGVTFSGDEHSVMEEEDPSFGGLGSANLCHIASFLPTLQSLTSLSLTSKRTNAILSNSTASETFYRSMFVQKFGEEMSESGFLDVNWTWKVRWATVNNINRGLQDLNQTESLKCTSTIKPATVGVLRKQVEEAALIHDNPQLASAEGDISGGYYGLKALNNLPSPSGPIIWEPPLILHGDFDGIKIYYSMQDFLSCKKRTYQSLGEDNGKVTSLVLCKWNQYSNDDEDQPCGFVGYDSGCVATLFAQLSEDSKHYIFTIQSRYKAHNREVKALTLADCGSFGTILFSACSDGQACFFPHAMNSTKNFSMVPVYAFSNSHPNPCQILSMTSTVIKNGNELLVLVCTGDSDGSIRLWTSPCDLLFKSDVAENTFRHVKWYKSKNKYRVTIAKFIQHNLLVSGNVQGDIRIWDLTCTSESGEHSGQLVPGLTLRFYLKNAHNGPVGKMCIGFGDIMLTAGGNDGSLSGWDLTTGKKVLTLCCHEGKAIKHPTTKEKVIAKSSVVGAVLTGKDDRLVTLCRDGVLSDWAFA